MEQTTDNWKTKLLIGGALIGAVVGMGTAYLLARTAQEANQPGMPAINTRDALKIGVSVIGVVRGIADLGRGSS